MQGDVGKLLTVQGDVGKLLTAYNERDYALISMLAYADVCRRMLTYAR